MVIGTSRVFHMLILDNDPVVPTFLIIENRTASRQCIVSASATALIIFNSDENITTFSLHPADVL